MARDYRHKDKEALLRPEGGAQDVFPTAKRKPPKEYRYDSSLDPEFAWDEAEIRGKGEQLIDQIINSNNLEKAREAAEQLKSLSRPFLNWTGKAERNKVTVPTLPLFVHERLSTQAVLDTLQRHKRNRNTTLDLFGEGKKTIGEKIRGAYEHTNGWQNRMILGDSLQVMNSLLEYESMGGQVQMIYMDPPYGVKYGSNFQPFVRKRDVKDGDDNSISREPEMVQAYRDTWELGVHSWLTYMRDRLLLARELLTNSGSCFVQISDEHAHLVRNIMDEVFGKENFMSMIYFATTSGFSSKTISRVGDYLIWFAKDKENRKYRPLFVPKEEKGDNAYRHIELKDGSRRPMTKAQREGAEAIPEGSRIFRYGDTQSQGATQEDCPFEFEGNTYRPLPNCHWKANYPDGMENLKKRRRLAKIGNKLGYVRYIDDFPLQQITNSWMDTGFAGYATDKKYVVQTSIKVIQRCILMTTDPGDLVLDPTCGSGTTAYVAEQWGRRWITTDVSRVPLALARQRLLTATYPYYQLRDEARGPGAGFVYSRKQNRNSKEVGGVIPHITLKSIANNEQPAEEILFDKPDTERNVTRISGPFCIEAVLPTPLAPENVSGHPDSGNGKDLAEENISSAESDNDHILRMIKVLEMSPVIHLPENRVLKLKKILPPAKSLNLHAEAELEETGKPVAIVFGPSDRSISERAVVDAIKETRTKDYEHLLVVAFSIESAARKTIEVGQEIFGLSTTYVQASTDLAMSDLLKNMRSSEIFSACGMPDIKLNKTGEKSESGDELWQVELSGLDVFDPASMKIDSLNGDDVPCWMLDTDYDGQCFRAGQVFFPRTAAWDKIRNAVRTEFEESIWNHLRGAVSAPFIAGEQIAVKVIDDRGNELLVVEKISEANSA